MQMFNLSVMRTVESFEVSLELRKTEVILLVLDLNGLNSLVFNDFEYFCFKSKLC